MRIRVRLLIGVMFAMMMLGAAGVASLNYTLAVERDALPLTAEQQRLVDEKARVFQAMGLPPIRPPEPGESVQGPQPSRPVSSTVHVSRAELEGRIEHEIEANAAFWDGIAQSRGDEAAAQAKETLRARRLSEIADVGPEGVDVTVSGAHVGHGSITFTYTTYKDNPRTPSDPTNLIWSNRGSASNVWYVLSHEGWASTVYENDTSDAVWACFSPDQYVYLWEAEHIQGTDHWKLRDWGAQRKQDYCSSGTRIHLRTFGADVPDSHSPGFGDWTVGAAHFEYPCGGVEPAIVTGHCVLSWENAENEVKAAFYDPSTNLPLWFVGQVWYTDFGNDGEYSGHYNDGMIPVIELIH